MWYVAVDRRRMDSKSFCDWPQIWRLLAHWNPLAIIETLFGTHHALEFQERSSAYRPVWLLLIYLSQWINIAPDWVWIWSDMLGRFWMASELYLNRIIAGISYWDAFLAVCLEVRDYMLISANSGLVGWTSQVIYTKGWMRWWSL